MSIKARLVHIKSVPKDTSVSYGRTFITEKPFVLGVVPMGYVDGVFRKLVNNGEVLIGDEVVLVGSQDDERITADEVGNIVGTNAIEIVTRMGKRMPIVYIE